MRQRPHLAAFMERVAQLFEVVVFTASQKIYAEVRCMQAHWGRGAVGQLCWWWSRQVCRSVLHAGRQQHMRDTVPCTW